MFFKPFSFKKIFPKIILCCILMFYFGLGGFPQGSSPTKIEPPGVDFPAESFFDVYYQPDFPAESFFDVTTGNDFPVESFFDINFNIDFPAESFFDVSAIDLPERNISIPNVPGPSGDWMQVNTYTGNLLVENELFFVPGHPDLACELTYNSARTAVDQGLGHGWTHTWNMYYELIWSGVIITRGDGQEDLFVFNGIGYDPPPGVFDTLTGSSPGPFTLTTKHGVNYHFNDNLHRKLTSVTDRNNNSLTLFYSPVGTLEFVEDDAGRSIEYIYDIDDRLTTIIVPFTSPPMSYAIDYDIWSNIESVTDHTGREVKYEYGYWSNITSVIDPLGHIYTIGYNTEKAVSETRCPAENTAKTIIYDSINLETTVTDSVASASPQVYQYQFDGNADMVQVFYPDGNITSYVYDAWKNIKSNIDSKGNLTSFTYDAKGNLLSITDPLSFLQQFTYDPVYNYVTKYIDQNGNTIDFNYDPTGNLIDVFYPVSLGYSEHYAYDGQGNITGITDRRGSITSFNYDAFGYITDETGPLGNIAYYAYDAAGNLISYTDKNSYTTTYEYDPLNRLAKIKNPQGDSIQYSYDANDRLTGEVNELGYTSTYTYDGLDRRIRANNTVGGTTEYDYDAVSNLIAITDANSHTTFYSYDLRNRLIQREDAKGYITTYSYDPVGNIITSTDENGNTTSYYYDDINRLDSLINAAGNTEKYTYDPVGNITTVVDMEGRTSTYTYDALDRLTIITDPFLINEQYTYDGENNIIDHVNKNGDISTYSYDALNRLYQSTDPKGLFEVYSYDPVGNRLSFTDKNAHTTNYLYDNLNRLTRETDPYGNHESYAYDAAGNRISITDRNTYVTGYSYDPLNRLTAKVNPLGDSVSYTYDAVGNRETVKDHEDRIVTYEYDQLDRVTRILYPLGYNESYEYGPVGNVIKSSNKNEDTTFYEYDALNRLQKLTGPDGFFEDYTYDKVGNMVTLADKNGNLTYYYYDALNRKEMVLDAHGEFEYFYYDADGRLTREKDVNGNETDYLYDCCRLIQVDDHLGFYETYEYDSIGNMVKHYNKNGYPTTYTYDKLSRIIRIDDTLGNYESYTYDAIGNRLTSRDKNGNITTYSYDPLNRLIKETDPINNSSSYTYDKVGNLVSDTNRRGTPITYTYDGLDRRIRTTDVSSNYEEYTYDGNGNRLSYRNKNANTTTYTYDKLDRLIALTDPLSGIESYTYDAVGNKTGVTDKDGYNTTYEYDGLNRLIRETDHDLNNTYYGHDKAGNLVNEIDRNGNTTLYSYDLNYRLQSVINPLGETITYTYDSTANLRTFLNANGNLREFFYDKMSRLVLIQSPLGFQTHFSYDAYGNMIRRVDANNDTSWYLYDALNQNTVKAYQDLTAVLTSYDPEGLPLIIANSGGLNDIITYEYDTLGRIDSIVTDYNSAGFEKVMKYTYDDNDNRVRTIHGSDTTRFSYDALDRVIRIVNPQSDTTIFNYCPSGRRSVINFASGVRKQYVYGGYGYLDTLTYFKPVTSDTIITWKYFYDNENNKIQEDEIYYPVGPVFTQTYQYDQTYRLTDVNTSWGDWSHYTYDPAGNRDTVSKMRSGVPVDLEYTYDADNRLVSESTIPLGPPPTLYNYDNNGNLVNINDPFNPPTNFSYNYENKITSVIPPYGPTRNFQYSGIGYRVMSQASPPVYYNVSCFYCPICCQWYCEIEYIYDDTGNDSVSYTTTPQTNEPISIAHSGGSEYYLTDALGSVRQMTDATGTGIASYEYDTFGESTYTWGSSPNTFGFTGQEVDVQMVGLELYNYENRSYIPNHGRFTSQDPLAYEPSSVGCGGSCNSLDFYDSPDKEESHHFPAIRVGDASNLYAYVGNNPVSYVDPLGLCAVNSSSLNYNSSDHEIFGPPYTCLTGACNCGSGSSFQYAPMSVLCDGSVYGSATCELDKAPCTDLKIKNYNKTCAGICTQKHEEKHNTDRKSCCDKGREAWGNAASSQIDVYRRHGLGKKNLARKIKNIDNDRKVIAARNIITVTWNNYRTQTSAWSECNAYGVSVQCANDLWDQYNCDCPKPEDKKCCRDIKRYKRHSERQKEQNCRQPGAENPNPPMDCPF